MIETVAVAEVDPNDDSIIRWVVFCHRVDPAVGYRRHVVVAAFDRAKEMERRLKAEHQRWQAEVDAGTGDPKEWFSGRRLDVGVRHPEPQPRRRS